MIRNFKVSQLQANFNSLIADEEHTQNGLGFTASILFTAIIKMIYFKCVTFRISDPVPPTVVDVRRLHDVTDVVVALHAEAHPIGAVLHRRAVAYQDRNVVMCK